MRKARFVVRFFSHRYRFLKFFVPFSYRPLRRALSYMVPNKHHPTYKKDRFATLMPTRSADKSRFLVLLHAEVSFPSAVAYRFLVALYGRLAFLFSVRAAVHLSWAAVPSATFSSRFSSALVGNTNNKQQRSSPATLLTSNRLTPCFRTKTSAF